MWCVFAGERMKTKGQGFYIFCVLAVVLIGMIAWGIVSIWDADDDPAEPSGSTQQAMDVEKVVPVPAPTSPAPKVVPKRDVADDTKLVEALRDGGLPTQEMGEHGSLEGALVTKTPMKLTQSQYNYLPDSPLLEFTDDMIWKSGENTYTVKKDAVSIQARHIQEASIALNVSPRVEWEKTTGYRLVEIPDKSLFSKLGMVSGDIIVSINGAMPDMEPMALMFVNMVASKRGASTIVVEHRGVQRTIELRAAE